MHFGENQLSRSLIGLSPLPTPHPPSLQPRWVRASTTSYSRFTLDMGRSPRFGSTTHHYNALFRLAFAPAPPQRLNLAAYHNSQAHSSKGTPSLVYAHPKRHTPSSDGLQAHGFRHSFTPLPGYFSPFPHGTLHYRSPDHFRLTRRSWQIHTSLHETRTTRVSHPHHAAILHLRDSHPLRSTIPSRSTRPQRKCLTTAVDNGTTPQPPTRNACRLSHEPGLASSAFARRYSRNHSCFLHSRY